MVDNGRRTKKQVRYRLTRNGDQVSSEGSHTGSSPVLTTKTNKDMKKLIKDFHKKMVDVCYPIDPFPVYMFLVLALLSPVIVTLLGKS